MKKICLAIFSGFLFLFMLAGCQKKGEYDIAPPKDKKIQVNDATSLLRDDIILDIEEYIPKVTEWYNSVDIDQPLPLDFVDENVYEVGRKLTEVPEVVEFLEQPDLSDKSIFDSLSPVNAITYQIATIMMTSEMNLELSENEEGAINVEKEAWIELGDKIRNAIDFYYKK